MMHESGTNCYSSWKEAFFGDVVLVFTDWMHFPDVRPRMLDCISIFGWEFGYYLAVTLSRQGETQKHHIRQDISVYVDLLSTFS